MNLTKDYDTTNIIDALRTSRPFIDSISGGFSSACEINISHLSDFDIELLSKFLPGNLTKTSYFIYIKNNKKEIVVSQNKEQAIAMIENQINHLDKKFIFSVYSETGIELAVPKEKKQVIKFFKKNELILIKNKI